MLLKKVVKLMLSTLILVKCLTRLRLIRKLDLMDVNNVILKWLSSYISCRSPKIRLHGYVSNNISIPSGVTQSGHVSLLLFILYMNDIGLFFKHAHFSMFADYLKLNYNINSLSETLNYKMTLIILEPGAIIMVYK